MLGVCVSLSAPLSLPVFRIKIRMFCPSSLPPSPSLLLSPSFPQHMDARLFRSLYVFNTHYGRCIESGPFCKHSKKALHNHTTLESDASLLILKRSRMKKGLDAGPHTVSPPVVKLVKWQRLYQETWLKRLRDNEEGHRFE